MNIFLHYSIFINFFFNYIYSIRMKYFCSFLFFLYPNLSFKFYTCFLLSSDASLIPFRIFVLRLPFIFSIAPFTFIPNVLSFPFQSPFLTSLFCQSCLLCTHMYISYFIFFDFNVTNLCSIIVFAIIPYITYPWVIHMLLP